MGKVMQERLLDMTVEEFAKGVLLYDPVHHPDGDKDVAGALVASVEWPEGTTVADMRDAFRRYNARVVARKSGKFRPVIDLCPLPHEHVARWPNSFMIMPEWLLPDFSEATQEGFRRGAAYEIMGTCVRLETAPEWKHPLPPWAPEWWPIKYCTRRKK